MDIPKSNQASGPKLVPEGAATPFGDYSADRVSEAAVQAWTNEGGCLGTSPRRVQAQVGGDAQAADEGAADADLNALLAGEQTSIMRAEAEQHSASRLAHEGDARAYRRRIDDTSYPARLPHDFDGRRAAISLAERSSAPRYPDPNGPNFDRAKDQVLTMENALTMRVVDGIIGTRFNTFGHRSRIIRREKLRLSNSSSGGPAVAVGAHSSAFR